MKEGIVVVASHIRYIVSLFAACLLLGFAVSLAPAAVLVDLNADGTARTGTTAHFEAATGLAGGTFGGDTVTHFDLNGPNVATLAFDQTVDNIRVQANSTVSTLAGDADGWFGGGTDNNLLEDGLFVRDTPADPTGPATLGTLIYGR